MPTSLFWEVFKDTALKEWISKNDRLLKCISGSKIWPFSVPMLNFWGVMCRNLIYVIFPFVLVFEASKQIEQRKHGILIFA